MTMTTEQEHFRNITALWHEAQQGGGDRPATDAAGISGRPPASGDEEFRDIKERFEETAALKPRAPENEADAPGTEISVIVESMIREKLHGEFAGFIRDAVRDVVRDEIEKQLAARNEETETPADDDGKEN